MVDYPDNNGRNLHFNKAQASPSTIPDIFPEIRLAHPKQPGAEKEHFHKCLIRQDDRET